MGKLWPVVTLAILAGAFLAWLVLPAWLWLVLASMGGAIVLMSFVSLLALACRPALTVWHEHRDKQAARRVMLLTAQSQAQALQARTSGSSTSASRLPSGSEHRMLNAAAVEGRVRALITRGYTDHGIVKEVWGLTSGRPYTAAKKLVAAIRQESQVLPPAPAPRQLADGRQVVAYAADAPARTAGTRRQSPKAKR